MDDTDRQIRLQILAMENATLLAHRGQLWSDASSRATMFLAVLSASVVAIAFAAQATAFDTHFIWFVLLLLPVVLYVGLVTVGRLNEVNVQDILVAQALNRVRSGILEVDQGARPFLAHSPYDDWDGLQGHYGVQGPDTLLGNITHGRRTLPALFSIINCLVAGVLAGTVAIAIGLAPVVVALVGIVVFVGLFGVQARQGLGSILRFRASLDVHYPSPEPEPTDPPATPR